MKLSDLGRYALSICAVTAILAGCGSQTPIGAPAAMPQVQPQPQRALGTAGANSERQIAAQGYPLTGARYSHLYSFRGGDDGWYPYAGLIAVNGALYGTTYYGGRNNYGTVFKVSTSGTERVLHSFKGGTDGAYPLGGLIDVDGALYGTTSRGGGGHCYDRYGCGTVFEITTSGKERVIYSFKGWPHDGSSPEAGLIDVNGTLYGTTYGDGIYGIYGSVFAVSTSGKERVLYSFKGEPDGKYPLAGLIDVKGALFGTTRKGGSGLCGSVFKVSLSGKERVLYNFKCYPDGESPESVLIDVNGALYGTTAGGGANAAGTVFAVNTSGSEHVLYSFRGQPDGAYPEAGLTDVNGMLYGTTAGGTENGTVFAVSTAGKERVLHRFKGGTDGAFPSAGLIAVNGALFGTTSLGGGVSNDGTVFTLLP